MGGASPTGSAGSGHARCSYKHRAGASDGMSSFAGWRRRYQPSSSVADFIFGTRNGTTQPENTERHTGLKR